MLIKFNLAKRINIVSIIMIVLFVVGITALSIYYADFSITEIEIKLNIKRYTTLYILSIKEVLTIIIILFTSVLSLMELFQNTKTYDVFFIVKSSKFRYFTAKLLSYFLIILFFLVLMFSGVLIVYLLRFKNIYYLSKFYELFLNLLVFSIIIFLESLLLIVIFQNSFVVLFPILFYWLSVLEINDLFDTIMSYVFPHISFDINALSFCFTNLNYYQYTYLVLFVILNYVSYLKKEIK